MSLTSPLLVRFLHQKAAKGMPLLVLFTGQKTICSSLYVSSNLPIFPGPSWPIGNTYHISISYVDWVGIRRSTRIVLLVYYGRLVLATAHLQELKAKHKHQQSPKRLHLLSKIYYSVSISLYRLYVKYGPFTATFVFAVCFSPKDRYSRSAARCNTRRLLFQINNTMK